MNRIKSKLKKIYNKKSYGKVQRNLWIKCKYTYERTANYCYKGIDILINKLNIINEEERLEYINIYCSNGLKQLLNN